MGIFTWILAQTDMSDEEKAARSSWAAPSGASNADIVTEAQARGFLSSGQAAEAMAAAHDRDVVFEFFGEAIDLG